MMKFLFNLGFDQMFIYADETGNSGRNIFDTNRLYASGALLTSHDVEPHVQSVIQHHCSALGVDRLHAHKLEEQTVIKIAHDILHALDGAGPWKLHIISIHKPYIATVKFVDTIFDSYENLAVPPIWYNSDLFRHTLCCAVDELLTPKNAERFWNAYLADNVDEVRACIINANTYLTRKVRDARVREVIRDAFQFFISHPNEFTFTASVGRKSYQGHTPNMIAFTSILNAIHQFVDEYNSPPIAFFHDQQQEFATSMKKAQETFGKLRHIEHPKGFRPDIELAEYDMAKFSMPSSKDMASLQAVDVLLWIFQRKTADQNFKSFLKTLSPRIDPFYISRGMSELIVRMRMAQLDHDIPDNRENWQKGEAIKNMMKAAQKDRLEEFYN